MKRKRRDDARESEVTYSELSAKEHSYLEDSDSDMDSEIDQIQKSV